MASDPTHVVGLKIMSYNMHGFHQGCPALNDAIVQCSPDLILLQEHWLTPANLYLFDSHFANYFSFGSSAMSEKVESGMLRGRPFGGVAILVKSSLRKETSTIHCSDRYVIVKVRNCLFVNVYLPCSGTADRQLVCDDVLSDIGGWLSRYHDCSVVMAGDFNVNLDRTDSVAGSIHEFVSYNGLLRCDELFASKKRPTYVNTALDSESYIDYMLVSPDCTVNEFSVVDSDINFSDHLPLLANISFPSLQTFDRFQDGAQSVPSQSFPRWDKADRSGYYKYTGDYFVPLSKEMDTMLNSNDYNNTQIDEIYANVASILINAEKAFVPRYNKTFFKFWWNEELSILKKDAVETSKIWKAAGKPRSGLIFNNRQRSRMQYRKRLRECEQQSTLSYTNDLHEALLRKNGVAFWKCWRAKFECSSKCVEVDNCVDSDVVVNKFASHFSAAYTPNDVVKADKILENYSRMRVGYCGLPITNGQVIDTELVSSVIFRLQGGKAPDIAGLTSEHLVHSHPSVSVVLCKLFKLIMQRRYVPVGFRHSYIVPIPKIKDTRVKSMSCNDFRGIAISPIVSKVFEHCVLDRFRTCFSSSEAQFGFKKDLGCRNAIYMARSIVDKIIAGGNTVSICAIDLNKAFDKVNHSSLFMKLMKRRIPLELLELLENWLSESYAYVKWGESWSYIFRISFGVRQGSVLSPVLFSVYIDDIGQLHNNLTGAFVVLYADDILLLAPSVTALQKLLRACEQELDSIDMSLNAKKSCCMRIGVRHDKPCSKITTMDGRELVWADEIRYLGVFIVRATKFKCSVDQAKRSFYRAANSIFARVGRLASEEVMVQLLKHKCLPILLYALEVCNLDKRMLQSLDFTVNRFFMKLFRTSNIEIVHYCQTVFGCELPSILLVKRYEKFLKNFACNPVSLFS